MLPLISTCSIIAILMILFHTTLYFELKYHAISNAANTIVKGLPLSRPSLLPMQPKSREIHVGQRVSLIRPLQPTAASRIVGGKDVPIGKYPYQVSLRHAGSHTCGGSIIDERWILTAAHCLIGISSPAALKVVAGTNSLTSGRGDRVYQAEYMVYHENFTFTTNINDIGLIRVNRKIEYNDRVKPVQLPANNLLQANTTVVLTGWGKLRANGKVPDMLQEINLLMIDQNTCNYHMDNTIAASHICTFTRTGEGACNGDSGGPLVVNKNVQVGIVSYGQPCAVGYPDVFTRVFSFLNWIGANINKF